MKFKIPLVIWGENSASEYGNENYLFKNKMSRKWKKLYGVSGTTAKLVRRFKCKDLLPYNWPTDKR